MAAYNGAVRFAVMDGQSRCDDFLAMLLQNGTPPMWRNPEWSHDHRGFFGGRKLSLLSRSGLVAHTNPLLAETIRRSNAKRDRERRLRPLRCQRVKGWHLLEELHDQYENVQVESNHGCNHVGSPPAASEVAAITREDRDRQHHQRYDADSNARRKSIVREQEPRDARRYRRGQKERRPAVESFTSNQPEYD